MAIDLDKLEKKVNDLLENETPESMREWLKNERSKMKTVNRKEAHKATFNFFVRGALLGIGIGFSTAELIVGGNHILGTLFLVSVVSAVLYSKLFPVKIFEK